MHEMPRRMWYDELSSFSNTHDWRSLRAIVSTSLSRSQVFRFSSSHLWLIRHASEVNHWEIQSCLMPCGSSLLPSFSVCPPEGGATGAKSKLRLSPPASGQAQCLHRWGHTWHKKADRGPLSFYCVHFLQKCGQMCRDLRLSHAATARHSSRHLCRHLLSIASQEYG
jgi:hypothetical protein